MGWRQFFDRHRYSVLSAAAGTLALVGIVWIALDTLIDWQVQAAIKRNAETRAKAWVQNFLETTPSAIDLIQTGQGNMDDISRLEDSFALVNIIRFELFNETGKQTFLSNVSLDRPGDVSGHTNALAIQAFETGMPVIIVHHDDNDEYVTSDPATPETYIEAYIPAITSAGDKVGTIELYVDASAFEEALETTFQQVSLYLVFGTVLVLLLPITAFVRRTQQLMQNDKRMLELTRYDQLTGVLNRNTVTQMLDQVFADDRRKRSGLGILFVDVDHFKQVNDQYGHACGDKLLQHIAGILQASIREGSDTVARYGGDEFVILCRDISSDDFRTLFNRVMEGAKTPCTHAGQSYVPSLSVGAYLAGSGDDQKTALHRADLAVYAAKRQGRGRVVEYGKELEGMFKQETEQHSA
ncbi:GGDEF domain-containing protein [Roseibium denhamense]|uniref:Diguanylate cyclase (GGDEF) domain-containing protein n=1 Tax=Roseibium denhamense TaxID=76305 RepID=A0ABY1NR65_9HYPH|nr:GGDEF domain-containing protein [Roseibium denhamense]MTI08088.1 GGDEF domain-containing protein [Roseibium denhamense]SMP16163.1 diguanylate cyclase (GGDEF) domain-containing protein [Roseibium denhamense]